MSRIYEELGCGCLISEDGGGGLLPCDKHFEGDAEKGDPLYEYYQGRKKFKLPEDEKDSSEGSTVPHIICVDLDGTLAKYKEGYNRKKIIGDPVEEWMMWGERVRPLDLLLRLKREGWFIIIFSVRQADEVRPWLVEHSIPYDSINVNPWQKANHYWQNFGKPWCDIYLDDRSINPVVNYSKLGSTLYEQIHNTINQLKQLFRA